MGRLVLHWVCVCALVGLPVGGCGDETAATGGTGGNGGNGGMGGDGGSSGMGGDGGSGGSDTTSPRTLSQRFVKDAASRDAVCNDGTDAAYYFEAGFDNGEGKWIISLQGGGQCGNPQACDKRHTDEPHRTGSASHPNTISLDGLFNADAALNPDFFNWNVVRILYCSSDDWRGSKTATGEIGGFHFRGHDIIRAVLEDLQNPDDFGTDNLANATEFILAGGSAGAIGVKHNLDRVAEMISWASVRGLDDSAFWSREAMGYDPAEASSYSERVAYQGLVFDESCATDEPEPDICAESMTVSLNHVATPYFVVIDQSDPVVLEAAVDQTPEREAAIAESARQLMQDHGAGFAPDMGEHSWLHDPLTYEHEIGGTSMLQSLGNWYFDRPGPKVVVQEP